MKTSPLVSIILPVFNSEEYIVSCVNSIISQSYINIEILIRDDFSSDNSFSLLSVLQKKDKRIKLFKNSENLGISKTLNLLLNDTQGEYIAIMNSDDLAKINRIKTQVDFFLNHHNVDLLGGNIEVCYDDKIVDNKFKVLKLTDYEIKKQLEYTTAIDHITLMCRSNVFNKLRYNEELPAAVDLDLFLNAKTQNMTFHNIDNILCTYRIHRNATGSKNRIMQLQSAYIAHKLFKEREKFGEVKTKKVSLFFKKPKSIFGFIFLQLSSLKREDNCITSFLRFIVAPFSSIGRYCLIRNLRKRIFD